MFDSNDKNQYQKIEVSAKLKQRILDAHHAEAPGRRSNLRSMKPVLAMRPALVLLGLLVLVISASVLFTGRDLVELTLNGHEISGTAYGEVLTPARHLAIDSETSPLLIHFTVETKQEATVQVSEGNLSVYPGDSLETKLRINGQAELVWSLDAAPGSIYELSVIGRQAETVFHLVFDDQAKIWLLKEHQ